jgi:hypothetical protein
MNVKWTLISVGLSVLFWLAVIKVYRHAQERSIGTLRDLRIVCTAEPEPECIAEIGALTRGAAIEWVSREEFLKVQRRVRPN